MIGTREPLARAKTRPFVKALRCIRSMIVFGAAVSVVVEFGFFLHQTVLWSLLGLQVAAVLLSVGKTIADLWAVSMKADGVRSHWLRPKFGRLAASAALVVVWVCDAMGVKAVFLPDAVAALKFAAVYFALVHMLPAPGDAVRLPLPPRLLAFLYERPTLAVVLSFLFVVVVGTALLSFPRATAEGERIAVVDALFTATSATCVTGLIVKDTPNDFSRFGHWVIMGLIQVGGLGIMTITAFFATAIGRRMRMSQAQVMQQTLDAHSFEEINRSVRAIILLTFTIEAVGAIFLFTQWSPESDSIGAPLFCSVFHSVSAFCNAGFSLFSNNLMDYSVNVPINITITSLIILGGLGFLVLTNLLDVLQYRTGEGRTRLSLHSRMALTATVALILGGAAVFFAIEYHRVLHEFPLRDKIVISYFQSVTTRTAGFNTVDIGALSPATQFGFMILMFIGGCPGSTAGGIKTTTAVILLLTVAASARGKERVACLGHTIPVPVIWRAISISVIALFFLCVCIMLLVLPFSVVPGAEHTSFQDIMFEAFSAFGTVGLSTGATPHLTPIGKLLIILLMFTGRVGPLSLAIALSGRPSPDLVKYPETNIMVG